MRGIVTFICMKLSFFGGGGGGGFGGRGGRGGRRGEGQRGGFQNARQQGRRQVGDTPMNNTDQNRQTNAVASRLRLTQAQAGKLHDHVSGQGWGFQRILQEARELFNID